MKYILVELMDLSTAIINAEQITYIDFAAGASQIHFASPYESCLLVRDKGDDLLRKLKAL